jgi:hypothetical protein
MYRFNRMVALFSLCAVSIPSLLFAQQLRVLSGGVASAHSGSHEWYDVEADPDDASNLITCGMKWDARDNANYGFVYFSQDSGKTWSVALEDKNNKHVSEESCAFGAHGVAYFVASSEAINGEDHHGFGPTRIWISRDSGKSWSLGSTTGWTDFSASAVDRNPGPNQNRLYIFFNGLRPYYSSLGDRAAYESLPNMPTDSLGLVTYKDGDRQVADPLFYPEMYKQLYRGAHPTQVLMLRDGSMLVLFWTEKAAVGADGKEIGVKYVFGAQHTSLKAETAAAPVILNEYIKPYTSPDITCWPFGPAVYDAAQNTVYATYFDESGGKCKLILTSSTDGGLSWRSHQWTEKPDLRVNSSAAPSHDYNSFALARNLDGDMALLWRDGRGSNCWYFATSIDNGQTYVQPTQLSACTSESGGKYRLSDAYLESWADQAEESEPGEAALLQVVNHNNRGSSHLHGIAVSPDGVFHPIWITTGNDQGQLRTAAIVVLRAHDQNTPETPRTDGWQYETNNVKFLYGGSQHYDAAKNVLCEAVIIHNSGTSTLKAPLRLEIDPQSRSGLIYPLDVTTEGSGQNISQYLNINQYVSTEGLGPGADSRPIDINLHFESYGDTKGDGRVATIALRLVMREEK